MNYYLVTYRVIYSTFVTAESEQDAREKVESEISRPADEINPGTTREDAEVLSVRKLTISQ